FASVFSEPERQSLRAMLERDLNSPVTSSVGRLFDAVASLIGVRHRVRHEGQAAMELEFAAENSSTADAYKMELSDHLGKPGGGESPWCIDWAPMITELLQDRLAGTSKELMAAKFHNALVAAIVSVATQCGLPAVVLSGGCFQNRYLTE